jgi:hypothetical protein
LSTAFFIIFGLKSFEIARLRVQDHKRESQHLCQRL